MKVSRFNIKGKAKDEVEIKDDLLILDNRGAQAVNDVVLAYLANQRQGNAKTKTRAEVSGGGKKPWRQKGTGRARAGSTRSPIWRHGGVVFGPQPRDWHMNIPRKVKALAFRKALSDRLAAGDVVVVDDFELTSHKTKEFVAQLRGLKVEGSALLVTGSVNDNLTRASRNVAWLQVARPEMLSAYDLLRHDHILMTSSAFENVTQRLTE